jgi:hypothetical protein
MSAFHAGIGEFFYIVQLWNAHLDPSARHPSHSETRLYFSLFMRGNILGIEEFRHGFNRVHMSRGSASRQFKSEISEMSPDINTIISGFYQVFRNKYPDNRSAVRFCTGFGMRRRAGGGNVFHRENSAAIS